MKISLEHLPNYKQKEITELVELIKQIINPEKVILFGSHAKGKQVNDEYITKDGIRHSYDSDYDFLVVTAKHPENIRELITEVENQGQQFQSPISLEVHELGYINKGLEKGQYFFKDIISEGILLYDKSNLEFAKPRELTPAEKKEVAQEYFDDHFYYAQGFTKHANIELEDGNYKLGSFFAHQAVENLFYTILLVFTGYKPKLHNLHKLRKRVKLFSEEAFSNFPIETDKHERHLFNLLKRAYIEARYSKDFHVSKDELAGMIERIIKLEEITKRICQKEIQSLG